MENDDKYLPELLAEKDSLDSSFTHAMKLLNAEIDRLQKGDTKKEAETYLDLFTTKNIKLKERVLIPVKQYPKEEGLRKGGEPKYAHLSMELHVFIEVFAPVPEAYLRMAHAMEEVKKFLFPDMMDDICQEQFMEMSYLNGGQEHGARGRGGMPCVSRGYQDYSFRSTNTVLTLSFSRGRGMPPRGAGARGGVSRGGPARGGAGYDESYTDTAYESYDSYYSQPQAEPEYYDYGHGETTESYESYGQDDWNGTQRTVPGKAPPPSRGAKTPYRDHPYR
ncbi:KH domain-containing, RNA-binding, signal transduction-associated protein 1, partial [Larimichthys crocea]